MSNTKKDWDEFAKLDAKWSVLTHEDKKFDGWQDEDFYRTGEVEVLRIFRRLEKRGVKINFDRALDFGCGLGRLTFPLSEKFKKVVGVDFSEEMISSNDHLPDPSLKGPPPNPLLFKRGGNTIVCHPPIRSRTGLDRNERSDSGVTGVERSLYHDKMADLISFDRYGKKNNNIDWILNDGADLSELGDGTFDFVLTLITLQHFENQEKVEEALCGFIKLLKPGGILYFQLPSVPRYGWKERLLKMRGYLYYFLKELRVSEKFMFERLNIAPFMFMQWMSVKSVQRIFRGKGRLLFVRKKGTVETEYCFLIINL